MIQFTLQQLADEAQRLGHTTPADRPRYERCLALFAADNVRNGYWRREPDGKYTVTNRNAQKLAAFNTRRARRIERFRAAKAQLRRHEAAERVSGR